VQQKVPFFSICECSQFFFPTDARSTLFNSDALFLFSIPWLLAHLPAQEDASCWRSFLSCCSLRCSVAERQVPSILGNARRTPLRGRPICLSFLRILPPLSAGEWSDYEAFPSCRMARIFFSSLQEFRRMRTLPPPPWIGRSPAVLIKSPQLRHAPPFGFLRFSFPPEIVSSATPLFEFLFIRSCMDPLRFDPSPFCFRKLPPWPPVAPRTTN